MSSAIARQTREIGMLMSAPMCAALKDRRKVQTRRLVKMPRQKSDDGDDWLWWPERAWVDHGFATDEAGEYVPAANNPPPEFYRYQYLKVPNAHPGDFATMGERAEVFDRVYAPYAPGDTLRFLSSWAVPQKFDGVKPTELPRRVRMWTHFDGEKPKWAGVTRPGRFLPTKLRRYLPSAVVEGVRAERLQEIGEEDAIAEGMNVGLLRDLLEADIGKFDPPEPYWSEDDASLVYCYECGKKAEGESLRGGYSGEEDSAPHCETCGCLLDFTCTNYHTEEEYAHCLEHGIGHSPEDAYCAMRMIGGNGNPLLTESCGDFHWHPEWKGGIAKICFRRLWEALHGAGSWELNSWVWAVSFGSLTFPGEAG